MAKRTYTREERRAQFLKIGIKLAKKNGIDRLTAAAIAREVGVTGPLLFHIFGTRKGLQTEVRKEAKKQGVELGPTPVKKKPATLPVPSNVTGL